MSPPDVFARGEGRQATPAALETFHRTALFLSVQEDRRKAAPTELFEEAKSGDTPIMVERVVNDVDTIVRHVRFDGWRAQRNVHITH